MRAGACESTHKASRNSQLPGAKRVTEANPQADCQRRGQALPYLKQADAMPCGHVSDLSDPARALAPPTGPCTVMWSRPTSAGTEKATHTQAQNTAPQ